MHISTQNIYDRNSSTLLPFVRIFMVLAYKYMSTGVWPLIFSEMFDVRQRQVQGRIVGKLLFLQIIPSTI